MVKKIIIAALALLFVHTGFAQGEKPDFKKIEKAIKDKDSPLFYKTLLKRYNDNDTTLTTEEYRHLYFGFSFQDGYSPYGKPSVNDELRKAIDAKQTDKIIDLEKKALKEYPFNLRNLYTLAQTMEEKGNTTEAEQYSRKLLNVGKAIMSTGDGATESTAMYVVSVDHEYDLISLLGFEFGGNQALLYVKDGPTDKMKLKKNNDNTEYMYFNVTRLFASMENIFKGKN